MVSAGLTEKVVQDKVKGQVYIIDYYEVYLSIHNAFENCMIKGQQVKICNNNVYDKELPPSGTYASVSPSILNAGLATLFRYRTSKKVGWVYGITLKHPV